MPGAAILPGGQVTASIRGSYYLSTAANFRSVFVNYVTMQGFRVVSMEIATSGYVEVDYTATAVIAPQASTTTDRIVDALRQAGENAGGSTPTVTITSAGERAQTAPPPGALGGLADSITKAVGQVVEGVGGTAASVGNLTTDIKQLSTIIIVGLVVIVGLVAFGPNIKSIAGNAR